MLLMKPACEACKQSLSHTDEAYICSYECTFCNACMARMQAVCPNCGGKLVLRPTRESSPVAVAIRQAARVPLLVQIMAILRRR